MAWVEKSGHGTWRVRFRRDDDTIGSVNGIVKLLTLILADAADERLIAVNPIQALRRGRRQHQRVAEKIWGTRRRCSPSPITLRCCLALDLMRRSC